MTEISNPFVVFLQRNNNKIKQIYSAENTDLKTHKGFKQLLSILKIYNYSCIPYEHDLNQLIKDLEIRADKIKNIDISILPVYGTFICDNINNNIQLFDEFIETIFSNFANFVNTPNSTGPQNTNYEKTKKKLHNDCYHEMTDFLFNAITLSSIAQLNDDLIGIDFSVDDYAEIIKNLVDKKTYDIDTIEIMAKEEMLKRQVNDYMFEQEWKEVEKIVSSCNDNINKVIQNRIGIFKHLLMDKNFIQYLSIMLNIIKQCGLRRYTPFLISNKFLKAAPMHCITPGAPASMLNSYNSIQHIGRDSFSIN